MHVFIKCPYCQAEHRVEVELWELAGNAPKLYTCEPAENGCGAYFAASFSTSVSVNTYKLDG